MKSFRTKTEVSVVIDRCVDTRGVWLDEEEFNHLRNAIGDIVKAGLDLETQAKKGKRGVSAKAQATEGPALLMSGAEPSAGPPLKKSRTSAQPRSRKRPAEDTECDALASLRAKLPKHLLPAAVGGT